MFGIFSNTIDMGSTVEGSLIQNKWFPWGVVDMQGPHGMNITNSCSYLIGFWFLVVFVNWGFQEQSSSWL